MDLESGPHKRAINEDRGNLLELLLGLGVLVLLTVEIHNPGKQPLDQGRFRVDLEDPLFLQELSGFGRLLLVMASVWGSPMNYLEAGVGQRK